VGGDRQLNLRAGSNLAPEIKSSSNALRAFTHALQTPVSRGCTVLQHRGIDTSAIVANSNPKYAIIVSDLYFNPSSVRMPIRISQDLERDAIDLIPRGDR
jgi:hypothetical protein